MENREILKLADLAAIAMTDKEIAPVRAALNEMMTLMDRLQKAPVADAAPLAHPLDARQRLRADAVAGDSQREALQDIAPETQGGFYTVPPVIE